MLPNTWQIHPVLHASLLSPYHETDAHGPNYSRPPPDLIRGEEFFEVEQIQDHWHHGRLRALQYLIKWKGSPESDNTWEPADLVLAPNLLKKYHKHRLLSGIKANQLTLHYPHHQHWTPQSSWASFTPSSAPHHTPLTNFTSLNCAPAPAKTSLTPLCIAAACTSPINMPSSTGPFAKNATVAIIPEDHLQCQPRICLAAQPLPHLHPLHPCPFQCASHPLNRPLTISPDILALVTTIPFELVRSLKKLCTLLLPPPTPGGSPSLPPLCRSSLLPHLIHPWTNSGPLSMASPPLSGLETMSIRRKSRALKPALWYYNRGWTRSMMDLPSVPLGMKKTKSNFLTSPSPLMMVQRGLPASSSSSMMEGLQDFTPMQRERRRPELLSYTPLQTIPLTNQWSCSPPGSVVAFGAIEWPTPFSKMQSTTLMIGDSLQMSNTINNMIKSVPTSLKRWSSWWPTSKTTRKPALFVKNDSLLPALQTKSNIWCFTHWPGPSSQPGKGGAWSSHPNFPPSRD